MLEQCPHCGANVAFISNACPNCGADRTRPVDEVASQRVRLQEAAQRSMRDAKRRQLWPLVIVLLAVTVAAVGLNTFWGRHKYPKVIWPPPSPAATLPTVRTSIKIGSGGEGAGWGYIYRDARKEDGRNALGWGPLAVEGDFDLPYNLFLIERPAPGYVENSFEVVYHDQKHTRVRLNSGQEDKVVLLEKGTLDFNMTFACVGSIVRCGGRVFVLRRNGWYLDSVPKGGRGGLD